MTVPVLRWELVGSARCPPADLSLSRPRPAAFTAPAFYLPYTTQGRHVAVRVQLRRAGGPSTVSGANAAAVQGSLGDGVMTGCWPPPGGVVDRVDLVAELCSEAEADGQAAHDRESQQQITKTGGQA